MADSGPLLVQVHPPLVVRGRVTFSWDQGRDNIVQRRNRWSMVYRGIPLRCLGRSVLYDVLLSLQLPLWAAMADTVEIRLPERVELVTLDFWTAYFGVGHVDFVGSCLQAGPGPPPQVAVSARRGVRSSPKVAVTFGGGKDSTLAQQALLESRRRRDVLLVHVIQHFSTRAWARGATTLRSLLTIVGPNLLRFRTPVQIVSTDFMANLKRGPGIPQPHINLYVAAMLPALIHRGVHQVVFSRTMLGYRVTRSQSGRLTFTNSMGRPERLTHLRRYCAHVLGWDLHAESTHRAIGEYVSFGTLLHRYPRAFAGMVMCTRTRARRRFCHDCSKCLEFALLGLSEGQVAPDLDYDRLLTSPRVELIVEQARLLRGKRAWHGAGPYVPEIGTASHFATWCHVLNRLDPERLATCLGEEAREHLLLLKEVWGPVSFPAVARLESSAVAVSGPLGQEVARVAASVFPVVDVSPSASDHDREHLLLVGDQPADRDDLAIMPTPKLDAWAQRWEVPAVSEC